MKGLELSRAFFEAYGRPMLEQQFPALLPYLAVGRFGSGSECFGYDDEISRDHDFEPGFCIFLPGEDVVDRRTAFLLERAYAKLPREFMGLRRSLVTPVGGARQGVLRTSEFFSEKIGNSCGELSLYDWLRVPEYTLAECTNGALFLDNCGEVSAIRQRLASYPHDVRCKKLAGNLLLMAQAGQYNYSRCLAHGETAAAQLAINEFVNAALAVIFLLNERYLPFYKWRFRALRELPLLSDSARVLEYLLCTPNDEDTAQEKQQLMEELAGQVISLLQNQQLTEAICGDLEKHAYSVNDRIADSQLRNMHILAAV
ncbi:MAG: DUF4037 domain-containing protein [Oscillospiraceae bacterium]|nr:DUF4037 domain-containing protein [Oscillospiraceae bacterium]